MSSYYVTTVKTNKPCIFTVSFELFLEITFFPKNGAEKNLQCESILDNSTEQSVGCTSGNFKIKLYYFQEKLSVRYNIILKLQSPFPFHICFLRNN